MSRPVVRDPAPWQFPLPEERILDNGLRLWRTHLPGQRLVSVELVLPAPVHHEPSHVEGVASVALHTSDEATVDHPEIVEELELQGAALGGSVAWHHSSLTLSVPTWRLEAALPLFADVVRQPAFEEHNVAHHVEALDAAWRRRQATPQGRVWQQLRAILFGTNTREGRDLTGTPESLAGITATEVRDWHARFWRPTGATLVIAGDLDRIPDEALVARFTDWEAIPRPDSPTAPRPRVGGCVVVDHPDAAQSVIRCAVLTPGRRDPDWAALKLGGHAMAGAFSSRLNLELRERRGFTYGVSGGVVARHQDGWFTVGASVATEATAEAVAHIHDHVALAKAFTPQEIRDCARFLVQVSPLSNETAADIAHQSALLAAAGEHPRFVNEISASLERTSAEKVTGVWRHRVRPADLTTVIVGPAERVSADLTRHGITHEIRPASA
ncbi:MAG: pitrilysin family protein [Arachnia propionica]|uniref:M16 family metallopeptidase n=1 Tax=Arachnia propionica TaxID=1750 RepID=UPI0026F66A96|nr:pitrilysin family protein [Arachnia propionica]